MPAVCSAFIDFGSRFRSPYRIALSVSLLCVVLAAPSWAQTPDPGLSFYVPQAGPVATPTEGLNAFRLFRQCPNNDGSTVFPNNARIKVVVRDGSGVGISGIAAADVCVLFNGGTAAQGFAGAGADSIIANSTWNTDPLCPDVRCIQADAPTDVNGTTYITFLGSTPGSPGVATRDPNRKWGHYDSDIPVFVLGTQLAGRLTTASANGTYVLRIKNMDFLEGLGAELNEGEAVTAAEFTAMSRSIGVSSPISYWMDFDSNGIVNSLDFNLISLHYGHDCDTPNNP